MPACQVGGSLELGDPPRAEQVDDVRRRVAVAGGLTEPPTGDVERGFVPARLVVLAVGSFTVRPAVDEPAQPDQPAGGGVRGGEPVRVRERCQPGELALVESRSVGAGDDDVPALAVVRSLAQGGGDSPMTRAQVFVTALNSVQSKAHPCVTRHAIADAAGLPPPSRLPELRAAAEQMEDAFTARGALAADAVNTDDDPNEWVEYAIGRLQRALAVDELHKVLGSGVTQAGLTQHRAEVIDAYDTLSAPIAEQLERITINAAALTGSTDAEASVRAGTTDELVHVLDGISRLGVMTAGLPKLTTQLKDARYLAYFVDVLEVDIAHVHAFGAEPVNPNAGRDAIVQAVHDVTGGAIRARIDRCGGVTPDPWAPAALIDARYPPSEPLPSRP